jgi:hypothetical protein
MTSELHGGVLLHSSSAEEELWFGFASESNIFRPNTAKSIKKTHVSVDSPARRLELSVRSIFNFFEISKNVIYYTTNTPTSLRSDWFESWCTVYVTTSKSGYRPYSI